MADTADSKSADLSGREGSSPSSPTKATRILFKQKWCLGANLKGKRREGMAGTTGLEPATSDVTGRRSNQLNYVPARANVFTLTYQRAEGPLGQDAFFEAVFLSRSTFCLSSLISLSSPVAFERACVARSSKRTCRTGCDPFIGPKTVEAS